MRETRTHARSPPLPRLHKLLDTFQCRIVRARVLVCGNETWYVCVRPVRTIDGFLKRILDFLMWWAMMKRSFRGAGSPVSARAQLQHETHVKM